jgi:hypothetical protein
VPNGKAVERYLAVDARWARLIDSSTQLFCVKNCDAGWRIHAFPAQDFMLFMKNRCRRRNRPAFLQDSMDDFDRWLPGMN